MYGEQPFTWKILLAVTNYIPCDIITNWECKYWHIQHASNYLFYKKNCSHCLHCFEEGNFQTFDMPDVLTSGNDTYNGLMRGWNHQRNVFVKILFLPRTAKLQFPELHVRIKTCRFLTVDTATIERTLAY